MDTQPVQPPFVGESRIRLVDGLVAILAEAEALKEARWVSLEAPSGWGKTRVAQELYARLAARQDRHGPGRYWPATILETVDAALGDVGYRRKRVFPDPARFDRVAGALPGFFWWGLACDQRSAGTASQNLLEDLQQIEAHAVYLDAAWARLASLKERLLPSAAQAKQAGTDVAEELAGHLVGNAIETLATVAIPGGGLLVKLARLGIGKAAETRHNRETIAAAGPLSDGQRPDLIDETLAMLTRLARPGLPVVVFVEDLHRAPPLVDELIERLVRANAALLVITSTWPGELERRERLMALAAEPAIAPRCLRVRHDRVAPPPLPAGASLDALPAAALADLVRAYHPRTAPATLALLAARFNNPLPLELICTLPKYRHGGPDGLALDPADIERLPRKVEDIYRDLWNALPEPAQQALALATLAIPDRDSAWHRAIARQAIAECLEMPDHDAVAETLEKDRIPHGWVRAVADSLRRFNEPDQLAIATAARDDHLLQRYIDRVLDRLAVALKARAYSDPDPETQHCARLLLTMHRQGQGRVEDTEALRAIRLLQWALADLPRELPARIALGESLGRLRLDGDSVDLLDARAAYGYALGESGRVGAALAALEALLADEGRILGPDHPDTLTTRNNIAFWRAQTGDIAAALAAFEALLADQGRLLGPEPSGHPEDAPQHRLLAGADRGHHGRPGGIRGPAGGSRAPPRPGPSGHPEDAQQHRLLAGGDRGHRGRPGGVRGPAGGSRAPPRPGPSGHPDDAQQHRLLAGADRGHRGGPGGVRGPAGGSCAHPRPGPSGNPGDAQQHRLLAGAVRGHRGGPGGVRGPVGGSGAHPRPGPSGHPDDAPQHRRLAGAVRGHRGGPGGV